MDYLLDENKNTVGCNYSYNDTNSNIGIRIENVLLFQFLLLIIPLNVQSNEECEAYI